MAKRSKKVAARPIKTRRDFERASAVVKRLSGEERTSAAELRLQSLLRELDRYDDSQEVEDLADSAEDYEETGPRRRWSDDAPGSE